ncbi:MAG: hypothetical protein ACXW27_00370 [Allosphingosinicella sp.]
MIEIPRLDTITFDDLVDEGRGLIPRYAPDWTDHNLHDPGITLLDLLAWIVDQQVYRIGFVGDAHLDAFAALLGVKRLAAVPARGLIWPRSDAPPDGTPIAAGTRASPAEQPDLAFSVTHAIAPSAAAMQITAHRPQGSRRVRLGDDGAIRLDPDIGMLEIEFHPPLVPVGEAGEPPETAPARFSLGLAYGEPVPTTGANAPVAIDYRDGRGIWHGAAADWIAPAGASSGALLLSIPPGTGSVPMVRLRLDAGLPRRLLPNRIALNAVPIVQIETLPALKVGEGQGWPDFELGFDLAGGSLPGQEEGFRPLGLRSRNGLGPSLEWTRVADFAQSGPAHCHFVLDEDRGAIAFGNGINGGFPERGDEISRDPLDVTRGARGNLAAAVDWTLGSGGGADGGPFGRNLSPVAGGSDAWSREDLLAELRRRARRRKAMVTDGELIGAANALEGYGIERAEVLARFHPALPGLEVPGARTLLLRAAPGVASDAWLDSIDRALTPGRVLGERLAVAAVREVEVAVTARLLVGAGSDQQRIGNEARQRLRERLAATSLGDGQLVEPWPSGRPVTIAELETLLAGIDDVVAVTDMRLAPAGGPPAVVSLPLSRTEVAVVAADRISISFAVEG